MPIHCRVIHQHLICQFPFIHLGEEDHCESKVSCPRTQCSDPSQGLSQGHCASHHSQLHSPVFISLASSGLNHFNLGSLFLGLQLNHCFMISRSWSQTWQLIVKPFSKPLMIKDVELAELVILNDKMNSDSLAIFPTLFFSAACFPTVTIASGDTVKKKPCTRGKNNKIVCSSIIKCKCVITNIK